MKIGILGCNGRMGQALIKSTISSNIAILSGGVVRKESSSLNKDLGLIAGCEAINLLAHDNVEKLFQESDSVIDFTSPEISIESAKLATKHGKSLIIGTTGFNDDQMALIKEYSNNATIIWSANMSVGVNILSALTEKVSSILDEDFDIEIVEMHHRHKVDSPSGTAILLGNSAAKGRKVKLNDVECKSRDGIIGSRPKGEIGFATLRGGDVVGEHTVVFAGEGERIELTHKASDRSIFAKGAVRAAIWSEGKPNGLYSMGDVLQI